MGSKIGPMVTLGRGLIATSELHQVEENFRRPSIQIISGETMKWLVSGQNYKPFTKQLDNFLTSKILTSLVGI